MKAYLRSMMNGELKGVLLFNDGVNYGFAPADPANTDYQAYLAWVAEGNTAEEWIPDAD